MNSPPDGSYRTLRLVQISTRRGRATNRTLRGGTAFARSPAPFVWPIDSCGRSSEKSGWWSRARVAWTTACGRRSAGAGRRPCDIGTRGRAAAFVRTLERVLDQPPYGNRTSVFAHGPLGEPSGWHAGDPGSNRVTSIRSGGLTKLSEYAPGDCDSLNSCQPRSWACALNVAI